MKKKFTIYYNRLRGQLWFRPLLFCLFSVAGALAAHQADGIGINDLVPNIDTESIEGLLDTISASMLVISIFAVASMLSAFSSASGTATPRSFKIVVTDDVSQNALSIFIGAFIFSIVATIALDNGYYEKAGRFILFLLTLLLFVVVILTFLKWVGRISRLGRLEHTIQQVETVASKSLSTYIKHPYLKALPIKDKFDAGKVIFANTIGYVQHINLESLQMLAEEKEFRIQLNCLPGKFVHKNFAIAHLSSAHNLDINEIQKSINESIHIGHTRLFSEDPRFGLISLTEIASRALSPGINDPGTAIQILGSHERLFFLWQEIENNTDETVEYDRVEVPKISIQDFFDDAFRPIARDGAVNIEVMLRLQKALTSIETISNPELKEAAMQHSIKAYNRAEIGMEFKDDIAILRTHCLFNKNL
ncbi:putative membrane protein [Ulvibacter sp. MAR_2010_11]|uniref:DUF2254 domain-containing protein n=1 Tax=Ulvibacter sp. MAR_2010_11 TaxID=1250229 RepID=UPI000C2C5A41|nr:DUF2254 domain-containing protein [Ulvibacter sp. MAR_2010_11]PKA81997.1 putative membrane protein [Ulvibacter sp. MAR_2010_11]